MHGFVGETFFNQKEDGIRNAYHIFLRRNVSTHRGWNMKCVSFFFEREYKYTFTMINKRLITQKIHPTNIKDRNTHYFEESTEEIWTRNSLPIRIHRETRVFNKKFLLLKKPKSKNNTQYSIWFLFTRELELILNHLEVWNNPPSMKKENLHFEGKKHLIRIKIKTLTKYSKKKKKKTN